MPSNLLGTLYAAMSGLNAFTRGLDNLSDNVANLNTTGYKANDVFYRELQGNVEFGQGGGQIENGQGVAVGGTKVRFSDGELAQTGVDTDMAIEGNGLFVVRNGEIEFYTRAGEFQLDEKGFLISPGTGYRVARLDDGGSLQDINLRQKLVSAAQASTEVLLRGTLNRTAVAGTVYPPANATDGQRIKINLYDSNGKTNEAFARFTRLADGRWSVELVNETGDSLGDPVNLEFGDNGAPTADTISQPLAVSFYEVVSIKEVPQRFEGIAEVSIADSPGELEQFGEITVDLDQGEFVLQPDAGESRLAFTESSSFRVSDEGYLVDTESGLRLAARDSAGSDQFVDARIVLESPAQATSALELTGHLGLEALDGDSYPPVTTDGQGNDTQLNPLEFSLFDQSGNTYPVTATFVRVSTSAERIEYELVFNYGASDQFKADQNLVFQFDARASDGVGQQRPGPGWILQTGSVSAGFKKDVGGNQIQIPFDINLERLSLRATVASAVAAEQTGGREAGLVTSLEIDSSGKVIVGYSNGDRQDGPALAVVDRQISEVRADFSAVNTADFVSSSIEVESVDGRSTGQLTSFEFSSDGSILLNYSNGDQVQNGRIALALFSNVSALQRAGDALFTIADLKQRVLGSGESGAFGKIVHRSIERSNVELSREFAEIIIVQRGFQASSQVLNATNELIEELYSSTRGGR